MSLDYSANLRYDDFRTQIMSVEELLYHCNESKYATIFKNGYRTSIEKRSRLVEALLLSMPQQPIFIDDAEQKWIVIDGIGRMEAIYSFCCEGMQLKSLFFTMDRYEGRTFASLSPFEKSKILSTKIVVHVLNPGLSQQERFGIYICLKSRIDSATLKWCRSRIYGEKYEFIENLAREINESLPKRLHRTDTIENRICHLLVGIDYKSFLQKNEYHHIDAVANSFLSLSDFQSVIEKYYIGIKETLRETCQLSKGVIPANCESLYDSVFFHKRQLGSVDLFRENLPIIRVKRRNGFNDSAEFFCELIDIILGKI